MPISWNEIRHNAVAFAKEWADVSREDAEAKSFWDAFFAVFGIKPRTVASFEEPVKKLSGSWGYIDLFWPTTLLVEHSTSTASNAPTPSTCSRRSPTPDWRPKANADRSRLYGKPEVPAKWC